MTRPARLQLTLAAAGTILGIGLGLIAAGMVPGLGSIVGVLVAIIGASAVVAIVLATTWPASTEAAADDTAWTEFRRELRRARRSGRPLTLLRIPMPEPVSSDVPVASTLVRSIGAELRLIDRTWVDGDSIYLMLPESSRSAASVVVDRLAAEPATAVVATARMATFPEDGLTSGALLAAVHGTAVGQVPIPLRPSHEEAPIRTVDADAALGGATGPR